MAVDLTSEDHSTDERESGVQRRAREAVMEAAPGQRVPPTIPPPLRSLGPHVDQTAAPVTNWVMPDVEDLRALWEIDLELARSDQGPIPIITTVAEKTWVWSDLHLGDRGALQAFDRPLGDVDQMNRHLLREWRCRVRSDDTIICLGDIAHPDAWRDRRQVLDIRDCPGKRVLVLGNHDVDPLNPLNALVIDRTEATLAAPGNPSLVLTHVPLRRVPAGWVNVHGHIHQERSPTDERHINVSVEQLDYRPARMSDIRRLARRLVKGTSVPGETTRVRLDLVEHAMT